MSKARFGKRALSWMMALVMLTALLPTTSLAVEWETTQDETQVEEAMGAIDPAASGEEAEEDDIEIPDASVEDVQDETDTVDTEEDVQGATDAVVTEENDESGSVEMFSSEEPIPLAVADNKYVLMNIPYAEFYAAEGAESVDAVSGATAKARNLLGTGSYHEIPSGEDGKVTPLGITYWVKVDESVASWLNSQQKVTDKTKVEIKTSMNGNEMTQTYEGKDALFEQPSYSYYELPENETPPASYKELTVNGSTPSFGKASAVAKELAGASAAITADGRHTNYEITVSGAGDIINMENVSGVTIHTSDNKVYGLHHVYEIWRGTELGFNVSAGQTPKLDIVGKTINKITYFLTDGSIYYINTTLPVSTISGVKATAVSVDAGTTSTTFTLDQALPNDFQASCSVNLDGASATLSSQSGTITLPVNAAFGSYTLTITDTNGKYAPITATFSLYGYVLMNIPYGEFYAAEKDGQDTAAQIDAVSSATKSKTMNANLAANSYHVSSDGSDITGITYPVQISNAGLLANYKKVSSSDDLFENESYAYCVLTEKPTSYKTLNSGRGAVSFGKASAQAQNFGAGAGAVIGTDDHHVDYAITMSNLGEMVTANNVSAVTLHTTENKVYGLRHVCEIWRGTSLGFSITGDNSTPYTDLEGKIIDKITYYLNDGHIYYLDELTLKVPKMSGITVAVQDVDSGTTSTTFALSGKLPTGFQANYSVNLEGANVSAPSGNELTGTISGIPQDALGLYTLTIKDTSGTYADVTGNFSISCYVLMNIPYEEFYKAAGTITGSTDYDAISSATNKVGNYGKSGGAFHSGTSAEIAEDGTVTAVGGENGAKNEGVIWPVKINNLENVKNLGGEEVTDGSTVTVATLGRGATSSTNLVGYETLTEAPAYSYYKLGNVPDNYLKMTAMRGQVSFSDGQSNAQKQSAINVTASYGVNWGDVQLNVSEATSVSDLLINAVVITAKDSDGETNVGLVHLYNVWSYSDIAWRVATVSGLDGKAITNIRYYCMVKDADTTDENAPAYANYIYDYPVNGLSITQVYTEEVTAKFDSSSQISISGLPADIKNPVAKVYHTTGGRDAVITYLTPLEVDPNDQDIDPINAPVQNGKIAISSTLVTVTNDNGEYKTYGQPVNGTEYTIEISSDNYIIGKITAVYTETKPTNPNPEPSPEPEPDAPVTPGNPSWPGTSYPGTSSKPQGSSANDSATKNPGTSQKPSTDDSAVKEPETVQPTEPGASHTPRVENFVDLQPTDWYYDTVRQIIDTGLMVGVTDRTFAPNDALNRGMLVTILYRMAGKPAVSNTTRFTDVQSSDWYAGPVAWASANSVVNGYEDVTFKPTKAISRQELAVILWRYAQKLGIDVQFDSSVLSGFTDRSQVADWAAEAMGWACSAGIIQGKGSGVLDPIGGAARAEAATMLLRFMNLTSGK